MVRYQKTISLLLVGLLLLGLVPVCAHAQEVSADVQTEPIQEEQQPIPEPEELSADDPELLPRKEPAADQPAEQQPQIEAAAPAALAEEPAPAAQEDPTAVFTVTMDGTTTGPMTLDAAIAEAMTKSGSVIHMWEDVTLSAWTSLSVTKGTFLFDAQGYTIRGLTTPLFDTISANVEIRDLILSDCNIKGIHSSFCCGNSADRVAGGIAACAGNLTLTGCKVTNSTVDGSSTSSGLFSQRNGYAGGLIGYNSGGTLLIQSCEVSNVTVKSNNGSAGGLIGHSYGAVIADTRISGNTISVSSWLNAWKVGGISGCIQGAAQVDVTEVTPSAISGNGKLIGRNYGGSITITGGSYFSDPTQYNYSGTAGTTQIAGGSMVQDEDGKWITKADADAPAAVMVAQINGVQYPTLQAAFDAAQDGDTIVLIADVLLTEPLVID